MRKNIVLIGNINAIDLFAYWSSEKFTSERLATIMRYVDMNNCKILDYKIESNIDQPYKCIIRVEGKRRNISRFKLMCGLLDYCHIKK